MTLFSAFETDYGYDAYGRMNAVSSGSASAAYAYMPDSDLLETTSSYGNGSLTLTTARQWDYGFRLSGIANTANGAVVTSHGYTYDNLNRRTQATLEDGSRWKYSYNPRNELTGAGRYWLDWSPVTGQQYGYAFDNIGNRTSASSGSTGHLRATSYTANNLNEYTAITTPGYKDIFGVALANNAVTVNSGAADRKGEYFHKEIAVANGGGPLWQEVTNGAGGATVMGGLVCPANASTLAYDVDGNLTFDGVWNYSWDAENRLIEMTMTNITGIAPSNRLRLDFGYDYMNRRVSKTVSTNSTGSTFVAQSTTYFIYDAWNLIAAFTPSETIQQSFVWGLDLSESMTQAGGIGGLLAITATGTNYFASYDGNGNITALINAVDKSTSARYEYSPFGELLRASGPMAKPSPFRFSTKFWDDESGLAYYGYRYYNPAQGRWIGRDSAGEQKGGNNLFAFCNNNSLSSIDTDGRITITPNDPEFWYKAMQIAYDDMQAAKDAGFEVPELLKDYYALAKTAYSDSVAATAGRLGGSFGGRWGLGEAGGFIAPELATVIGGVGIATGAGLVIGYVVDQTSQALGKIDKEIEAANDAIIDYWSDPNTK